MRRVFVLLAAVAAPAVAGPATAGTFTNVAIDDEGDLEEQDEHQVGQADDDEGGGDD